MRCQVWVTIQSHPFMAENMEWRAWATCVISVDLGYGICAIMKLCQCMGGGRYGEIWSDSPNMSSGPATTCHINLYVVSLSFKRRQGQKMTGRGVCNDLGISNWRLYIYIKLLIFVGISTKVASKSCIVQKCISKKGPSKYHCSSN